MNYYKLKPCPKGDECPFLLKDKSSLSCAYYHRVEEQACPHYYHGHCRAGDRCSFRHYQLNVIDAKKGEHIYGFEHDFLGIKARTEAMSLKYYQMTEDVGKMEKEKKKVGQELEELVTKLSSMVLRHEMIKEQTELVKDPIFLAGRGYDVAFQGRKLSHYLRGIDDLCDTLKLDYTTELKEERITPWTLPDFTHTQLVSKEQRLARTKAMLEDQLKSIKLQQELVSRVLTSCYASLDGIPLDVLLLILTFMDVKSRGRFMRASKRVRKVFLDTEVSEANYLTLRSTFQIFEKPDVKVCYPIVYHNWKQIMKKPEKVHYSGEIRVYRLVSLGWTLFLRAPIKAGEQKIGLIRWYYLGIKAKTARGKLRQTVEITPSDGRLCLAYDKKGVMVDPIDNKTVIMNGKTKKLLTSMPPSYPSSYPGAVTAYMDSCGK